jgi:hypothetical protein
LFVCGCSPQVQPPPWRTRVSLFVWLLPLDLSGLRGPTSSYVTAGIALRVPGALIGWTRPSLHLAIWSVADASTGRLNQGKVRWTDGHFPWIPSTISLSQDEQALMTHYVDNRIIISLTVRLHAKDSSIIFPTVLLLRGDVTSRWRQ